MRGARCLLVCSLVVLAACGGADPWQPHTPSGAPQRTSQAPATAPSQEAVRQLLDFAEASYPNYFPGHKVVQASAPFLYRYYPETGIYLGVVTGPGSPYELGGVYVLGGSFGGSPQHVGALTSFITPVELSFQQPVGQGYGGIVSDPTIRPFEEPGWPATFTTSLPIDFRGNGQPDLFGCYVSTPPHPKTKLPCRVLRPLADGSVADVTRQIFGAGALPGMEAPREIVTGDFNGDGRVDIFIAGHGYDTEPFDGETNVLLISNADGTYTDRSSTLPQVADFSHSACVGDVNGDGHLDIYVGNIGKVGPYFLMGVGDGTFTKTQSGLPASLASLQETYTSCLIVDADSDGRPDLVLGASNPYGSSDSVILFNSGQGVFTSRPRYKLPQHPFGAGNTIVLDLVALDINADGKPDLLVVATQPSYVGNGLQVLVNKGDGAFADETVARAGTGSVVAQGSACNFLKLADFNGDGHPDLYCNIGPTNVANRYWISDGYGRWNSPSPETLPQGFGFGVHAVDFNGDGLPDLMEVQHDAQGDVRYRTWFNRTGL